MSDDSFVEAVAADIAALGFSEIAEMWRHEPDHRLQIIEVIAAQFAARLGGAAGRRWRSRALSGLPLPLRYWAPLIEMFRAADPWAARSFESWLRRSERPRRSGRSHSSERRSH